MIKQTLLIVFFVFLAINSFAQSILNDTIKMVINKQNTIYIKTVFNEKDTLNLNFDTGTSELVLTHETIKNKLKSTIQLFNTFYPLKIGRQVYKTKIYDAELSGHDTDGRFGWDFFDNNVVELNYDKNIMVISSKVPEYVLNDSTYTKLVINYFDNVFSVESKLIQNGIEAKYSFLFDTGYQRTAMLDNDLMKENNFPFDKMKEIKKVIMRGGQGNKIPVITSNLDCLKVGNYNLKNVPIQQLTINKPMKGINIHILGNEVLKRFNTFLDFKNNIVYLKPNKLYNEEYIDKINI
ncbi:aspartyl protease family protein [Chishuiella sp.]|uniref:aspartyl protease family protein n=1 Tax=Chishuiella sp. TaxID=1969467 RepID=UPI0028B1F531|nr:aspartyl protease family protein [Chishuiella sp.]